MNSPSLLDQFPVGKLDREAEAVLASQIKQGSKAAATTLVMHNMREALLYTGRVCNGSIDEATRTSLCYQELCMSAPRFRPGGIRFFAFAKVGLRGRMIRHRKSLLTVRNAFDTVSIDSLEKNGVCQKAGRHELKFSRMSSELSSPADDHEHSPREAVTGEIESPDWDKAFAVDQWKVIRDGLKHLLSDQQWMILDLVYFNHMNFPEIGKRLGLTRSAIHAAHRKALKKLRDGLAANPQLLYVEDSRS
jgi:RNA polymerase sigma factor (sigma-70 family)